MYHLVPEHNWTKVKISKNPLLYLKLAGYTALVTTLQKDIIWL